jgi:hypothetical protein
MTSATAISVSCPINLTVKDLQIVTTTSGNGILTSHAAANVTAQRVFSGAIATYCFFAQAGKITIDGNYTISGSQQGHYVCTNGGYLLFSGDTVTLTGTPAFSLAFAYAAELGIISTATMTYSGSGTGKRYSASLNAVIQTFGGGASYFPGNVAGTTATGGQYA